MLKIGTVSLTSQNSEYSIIWYSDKSKNERIDVIEDIADYNGIDTSNCVSSLIVGRDTRQFGDGIITATISRIKQVSSFLRIAEKRDVKVEDGKFIMEISKEQPDIDVYYKIRLVNGETELEYYRTEEGCIEITHFSNNSYTESDRPINWEEYIPLNTISLDGAKRKKKGEQAEFYSFDELLRKYPQVSHVLDESNDYVVIESYEEAVERLNIWINSKEQLKSFDIESFGTEWGPHSDNRITGVFLGFGEKWSTYFPFRQQNFEYNLPLEFLRKIFDAINNQPKFPEVILLSHNSKFEIQGFYQEFREYVRCDIDTYILAVLVDPLIKKGSHTLDALTAKVDQNFYLTLKQIFIGPVKFNVLPPDIVKLYGCPDATSPAKIYPYLMERLPKDEYFVMMHEMKLPVIKAMNEFYGIRMDQERLNTLIEEEEYKIEILSSLFKKMHRTSRNINSNAVLSDILYNKLRCKVEVRTEKGAPATSKAAIDRIIKTGIIPPTTPDITIPKDIVDKNGKPIIKGKDLAYNKYPSLIIYQAYKKCCKELGALKRLRNKSDHGFFKFYINQVGANSNRQTSDAHQFSDTMKSCVISDSRHHNLVSCDWKQVELRVLAGMAEQEDLIELERDPTVDIHRAMLSIIQGKPIYLISEEDRQSGKSVNFGVVYGMTEYGLAITNYGPAYTRENLQTERKKITDFFNGLPKVKTFLKRNEDFMLKNGYIKTAFKYYRYFPELLDPTCDPKLVKKLLKAGGNTPIQGTAAQMMKMAESRVWDYIRAKGWDKEKDYDGVMLPIARMILPIHDEILFSYDKELITKEEIITMFKECMELDINGMPPFFAAPAFVDNWYDGGNSVYEVDIPFRDIIVEEYKKGNLLLTGKDYVQTLIDFRKSEIKTYMDGLISKHKDIDKVAKNVTDGSLTHVLIETMIPDKNERKKFTHTERIKEAVKRYFERLASDGTLETIRVATPEKDNTEHYMDIDEWSTSYTRIDANGDLIVEEMEGDYEDKTEVDDEILPIEDRDTDDPSVLFILNECLVDLTGMDMDTDAEFIHQGIQKLSKPNGHYNVVYINGYKTVQTDIKVDYCVKEIEDLFNKVRGKGLEVI